MAVACGVWPVVLGNGFGQYKIPEGAVMKIRNSKLEIRSKLKTRILSDGFSAFMHKCVTHVARSELKAVEDSRTPKPCGGSHVRLSAPASWSAAVLCRFDLGSLEADQFAF